ncbi:transcriptional regulator GlxA family with amidase domain [Saccharothrix tamanrassetensis]|uniref:Transcriptional regulator GlxA family with amidase domain n=1 Tax=Saccharothrix tamanrassetensis TaxID=1051531 RepID=A0A841CE50_9PSEU|nr:helix-turn-helix domain-containing protein [Saccharothrix tamanrassetensis]MBB5955629.1 transcriptional regulator GlxA family with amidase domain [Saccharothrix tamanrassetensis]
MLTSVAVPLIDGVTPFEFGVICEVFGIDRTEEGVPLLDFRVCGERPGEPVRMSVGASVIPEYGFDALDTADLVAVPACAIRSEYPRALLEAVGRAGMLLSVCSGSFVLGEAGRLDGRRCTTHWRHTDELSQRFPKAQVDPDVLFVDDGDVITSAGTAAGIDACLHLVRRELGAGVANAIARRMVVAPQRDGGQRQFIQPTTTQADSLQPTLAWMLEHLDTEHSVASLADHARMSERTFARRFAAETGTTPHRWLTTQRVLRARQLLEETHLNVETIAHRCGFGTAALLRHHFNAVVGLAPKDYRRSFAHGPAGRQPPNA